MPSTNRAFFSSGVCRSVCRLVLDLCRVEPGVQPVASVAPAQVPVKVFCGIQLVITRGSVPGVSTTRVPTGTPGTIVVAVVTQPPNSPTVVQLSVGCRCERGKAL